MREDSYSCTVPLAVPQSAISSASHAMMIERARAKKYCTVLAITTSAQQRAGRRASSRQQGGSRAAGRGDGAWRTASTGRQCGVTGCLRARRLLPPSGGACAEEARYYDRACVVRAQPRGAAGYYCSAYYEVVLQYTTLIHTFSSYCISN